MTNPFIYGFYPHAPKIAPKETINMALSTSRLLKLRIIHSIKLFRFRSSSIRSEPTSNRTESDQKIEFLGFNNESLSGRSGGSSQDEHTWNRNKVMVVIDSSNEAKGALDWALSHAIQSQDTVVLLYVNKAPRRGGASNLRVNMKAYELLHLMKSLCLNTKPGVQVEMVLQQTKEKGPTIVEEAKQRGVSLLVLGQRKMSIMWFPVKKRWRVGKRNNTFGGGWIEYCIQNASCMTIAVRRKGKKLGGYLITTKRHKNFWLLA